VQEYINEWLALKPELDKLAAREKELRVYIAKTILEGAVKGSRITIFNDVELKATAKQYINVDKVALDLAFNDLSDFEKQCLRYKPEFVMSNFNKLPADSILRSRVAIAKEGMPTLEIKTA